MAVTLSAGSRTGTRHGRRVNFEIEILARWTRVASLLAVLLLVCASGSCYAADSSASFGFTIHHRFSDAVREIFPAAGDEILPERGTVHYFAAMAERDRIHGRRLAAGSTSSAPLTFVAGNTTYQLAPLGLITAYLLSKSKILGLNNAQLSLHPNPQSIAPFSSQGNGRKFQDPNSKIRYSNMGDCPSKARSPSTNRRGRSPPSPPSQSSSSGSKESAGGDCLKPSVPENAVTRDVDGLRNPARVGPTAVPADVVRTGAGDSSRMGECGVDVWAPLGLPGAAAGGTHERPLHQPLRSPPPFHRLRRRVDNSSGAHSGALDGHRLLAWRQRREEAEGGCGICLRVLVARCRQ